MMMKFCAVEGCGRAARTRGWCDSHYRRFRRTGRAEGSLRPYNEGDLAARLMAYVEPSGGCWQWVGAIDKTSGYGRISMNGAVGYAHRASYEVHVGAIPDGLVIDHLCRNRACVNPAHLEPVTNAENVRRGFAARRLAG